MKQIVTIFQKQYMQCMPFKQVPLLSGEEVSVDQKAIIICYVCLSNKAPCIQGRRCRWIKKQYLQCVPLKQIPLLSGEEVSFYRKTRYVMRVIQTRPLAFRGGVVIGSKNNIRNVCHSRGGGVGGSKTNVCYACHSNKAPLLSGEEVLMHQKQYA